LLVFIGGGCTGGQQPLDTHTHGPLSAHVLQLEMDMILRMADDDPGSLPVLSRSDLMGVLLKAWRRPSLHLKGAKAFKANLLHVALDGSEFHEGSEECRGWWTELHMDEHRNFEMLQVKLAFDDGQLPLTFDTYLGLLEPFPRTGHLDELVEGMDDEGAAADDLEDGGARWDDEAGEVSNAEEDAERLPVSAEQASAAANAERLPVSAEHASAAANAERLPLPAEQAIARDDVEVHQKQMYFQDMERYSKMSEMARTNQDIGILHAVELARQATARKAKGSVVESELIADAMRRLREDDDGRRVARRLEVQRQKEEAAQLATTRAQHQAERDRLTEDRFRLRMESEAVQLRRDSLAAAQSFDASDFAHVPGQKNTATNNRWVAMPRVLLLSEALPRDVIRSLPRDWGRWDNCNLANKDLWPTPAAYAIQYDRWLRILMAYLAANEPRKVWLWWRHELRNKVAPADIALPSLPDDRLLEATHLHGHAPTTVGQRI